MAGALGDADGGGSVDPFDDFVFDEDFVRSASYVEPSAAERAAVARRRVALAHSDAGRGGDDASEEEQQRWRDRRRRVQRRVAWIVLGGLAAWAAWFAVAIRSVPVSPSAEATAPADPGELDLTRLGTAGPTRPTPGRGEAPAPLGDPPKVRGNGGYEFVARQADGTPVAYDPCRAIHYVVNDRTAPPGADRIVADAISRISAATGLRFVADGSTTERPGGRSLYQPRRYGDRWAPVLISWTDAGEEAGLDGDVVGLGGSAYVEEHPTPGGPPTRVYVSGALALDGADLAPVLRQDGGRARVEAVVLHELSHVVGLDHVNDPTQLMYPRAMPGVVQLGAGDLRGLAALGAGSCHPEL